MTPYFADDWLTVYQGDCREVMAELDPESVHCVVTSPPYWGLRDYGTATWLGGDPDCDHSFQADPGATSQRVGRTYQQGHAHRDCRCGAIRQDGQLGLEQTPEEYVAGMVAVFREVRRVLRPDGTVWLNLGDSYAGGTQTGRNDNGRPEKDRGWAEYDIPRTKVERRDGLKPKDLVGIPWRVAFALQADGWYLRSDIIWAKPNPMPESVTDRPTKSHEYLFLLTKSARYYFDADAVREPMQETSIARAEYSFREYNWRDHDGRATDATARKALGLRGQDAADSMERRMAGGRNLRTVWTIATQPYPGAHFATFPEKLVEPCVKAGCPSDGVVLDPFAGSGTTGRVANRLGRRAILIDLSTDYLEQTMKRNAQAPLGLGA